MPAAGLPLDAIDALGVRRLVTDSRRVRPGDTFVAYPGETLDGRDYIAQALARGAHSVLWESAGFRWNPRWHARNLGVRGLRERAGEIASHVYGRPSARLWTVGVTGTNGKTSCSHWIAQSLTRARRKCGIVGTLGCGFPGRLRPAANTTPDAVTLHAVLRGFVRRGARAVAMEASSHGLAQHRLSGVEFDVALFTNLTRDHLDYHGTMRRYRAAKARLFRWPTLKHAVLNLDDAFGAELAARTAARGVDVLGYGFSPARGSRLPRVQGRNLRLGLDGMAFEVSTPWGGTAIDSPLLGRFNAYNLLGTLAVLLASGLRLDECAAALRRAAPVAGRTERYGGGRRPLVIVDYAHTPDALEKVLLALREPAPRGARLICVFGCGGERDRGKRPLMGRVASRLADEVVVTSDNPRGEDPRAIIADILQGVDGPCTVVPDRARAIRAAIESARRGDIVLIAGKGHERYQEAGGRRRPFSDAALARRLLRERAP
jgi:UDP-N-acetylmuramoyl-L-alanyl-D-glutamate--2,6-diaminopimelate ligase